MSKNNVVIKQFEVGKIYSFDTYAPDVLGSRIINVECVSIMNAKAAINSGLDIVAHHERLIPFLPIGYNKDPFTMVYVKLASSDGKETIFSIDWINLDTLEETTNNKIVVTITDVSRSDIEVIRKSLVSQGYNNLNISLLYI